MAAFDPAADPFGGATPITTPGIPVYQDRFLSEFSAPGRDVLGAMFSNAFEQLPTNEILDSADLYQAEHGRPTRAGTYMNPDSPLLSPDAAKAELEKNGLAGQIEIPETGIRQRSLDMLTEHRIEQNRRNAILARSPGGLMLNAAGVAGTLAISALDPVNVASAFVPVVGEARYARMLEAAGESALARTAVRAGVGAAEGVAGGAALEPLHMAVAQAYQDDYTMNDALANLAFQGLFGAVMHQLPAAAGWLSGRLRRSIPMETQKAALSEGLSAFMEDRQPRVSELLEGVARGELMGSTSLSRGARFDPTVAPDRFEMPEAGNIKERVGDDTELSHADRAEAAVNAYALQQTAEYRTAAVSQITDALNSALDTPNLPKTIRERLRAIIDDDLGEASNDNKDYSALNESFQKAVSAFEDNGIAVPASIENLAMALDKPHELLARSKGADARKFAEAEYKNYRDYAKTATNDALEREIGWSSAGPIEPLDAIRIAALRDELEGRSGPPDIASPGALQPAEPMQTTLQQALDATAPDQRSLLGVLTRIRDDRVNLPVDDARLMAETTRATPTYNKPVTPESAETELAGYAAATDDAVNTMAATGRLTEQDMALLADADKQIALAEQKGMGWKAATACIARAFT